jgi:hypothetical protein
MPLGGRACDFPRWHAPRAAAHSLPLFLLARQVVHFIVKRCQDAGDLHWILGSYKSSEIAGVIDGASHRFTQNDWKKINNAESDYIKAVADMMARDSVKAVQMVAEENARAPQAEMPRQAYRVKDLVTTGTPCTQWLDHTGAFLLTINLETIDDMIETLERTCT